MQKTVKVLLVTALVVPFLFLSGCCGMKCEPEKCYDKCGTSYTKDDGK